MRPKKRILLLSTSEERASVLSLLLRTRGYAVEAAYTAAEAMETTAVFVPDVIMGVMPLVGMEEIFHAASVPTLLLAPKPMPAIDLPPASITLFRTVSTSADLLDRIKLLAARTRRPKSGYKKDAVAHQVEAMNTERRTA